MTRIRSFQNSLSSALLIAIIGSVAVVGCKKKEEAPPPVAAEPAPAPAPAPAAPAPAPAPTASITTLDLGNAAGADMKIAAPTTSFKTKDKIIASVGSATSDPAATVAGKLGAKWTFQDGQVVKDDSKDVNFTGAGLNNFEISNPKGWPVGKYKVEISLDGKVVQSKDFEVTK